MMDLKSLLERLSNSLNKDTKLKDQVIQIIKNHTHIEINPNQINLKDGILEINANPIINNEIRLKENLIKPELRFVRRFIYK